MKKIYKNLAAALLMVFAVGLFTPAALYASPADEACAGITAAGGECDASGSAGASGFKDIIATIINVLSILVGAVSVIFIIIGGFRYVISNGDSNGVTAAKNTIMYAIVGLVVVLFAQVLVAFVFSKAKDATNSSGGSGTGGSSSSSTTTDPTDTTDPDKNGGTNGDSTTNNGDQNSDGDTSTGGGPGSGIGN